MFAARTEMEGREVSVRSEPTTSESDVRWTRGGQDEEQAKHEHAGRDC